MNRTQYYNKRRAYRVISNRDEQHPNNWENWMTDFPYWWRFPGKARAESILYHVEQSKHWRVHDEDDRRKILKGRIQRAMKDNLALYIR